MKIYLFIDQLLIFIVKNRSLQKLVVFLGKPLPKINFYFCRYKCKQASYLTQNYHWFLYKLLSENVVIIVNFTILCNFVYLKFNNFLL